MAVLSSILFSVAILLFGVIVGTAVLRNGSHETSESMLMSQPMVGGSASKRQGPWPECIGKSGADCITMIEAYAQDVRTLIVPADSMVTMDFSPSRVRVFVDENGIVQRSPSRG
ncbi:hypothetical protein MPSEU_000916700 [Mayamaea pseudoterrestris]|nr:hypothetical protein MPSEU_000916700 [Mayamaea pseudoterrestris]